MTNPLVVRRNGKRLTLARFEHGAREGQKVRPAIRDLLWR
jgi:hypothetical protein